MVDGGNVILFAQRFSRGGLKTAAAGRGYDKLR
jgi:hypothetical protein